MQNTKIKYFSWGAFFGVILSILILVGLTIFVSNQFIDNFDQETLPLPSLPNNIHIDYSQLQLTDVNNKLVDVGLFKDKVIFINLWATWCAPCIIELPTLIKLSEKLKNENVAMLFISPEGQEEILEFVEKEKHPKKLFFSASNTGEIFKNDGFPHTYIFDKKGRLVFNDMGASKWDDKSVVNYLKELAR
jgi:thiol-disulfide isomerase/thioredoxin